jgi:hypothetical protein
MLCPDLIWLIGSQYIGFEIQRIMKIINSQIDKKVEIWDFSPFDNEDCQMDIYVKMRIESAQMFNKGMSNYPQFSNCPKFQINIDELKKIFY